LIEEGKTKPSFQDVFDSVCCGGEVEGRGGGRDGSKEGEGEGASVGGGGVEGGRRSGYVEGVGRRVVPVGEIFGDGSGA